MYTFGEMQSAAGTIFSAYASVAASMMLFRSIAHDIIPEPIKSTLYLFFTQLFSRFFTRLSTQITIIVDEQSGITRNQIYDAAELYLRTIIDPDTDKFKVNKNPKQNIISVSMVKDQQVIDHFKGFKLTWQFVLVEAENQNNNFQPEKKYFELTFDKPHKNIVMDDYLPFVLEKAREIKDKERAVKLYTRDCPYDNDSDDCGNWSGYWGCVNLDHPSTFDKLAMDPSLKRMILEDLDRFVRRKDYYKRVGKAWKRGYLLYGPPGTGKSSLIAAMANYLKFDVYDLELASLYSDSELRRSLLSTTNRSIIVIEDIDCNSKMHDREAEQEQQNKEESSNTKLTLSGLLNFIDGLWSTCGDERIIIFTTNHKDKLDPALIRPGRMDMHIHMGYCTPEGFDVLAHNYLGINNHAILFPEIKRMIREVDITPAEIAEHLMRSEESDVALKGVIELLERKKEENVKIPQSLGNEENKNDGVIRVVEKQKMNFLKKITTLSRGSKSEQRRRSSAKYEN